MLYSRVTELTSFVAIKTVAALLVRIGMQVTLRKNFNINRDLLGTAGWTSLRVGLGAYFRGYAYQSATILAHQLKADDRAPGVTCAVVCVLAIAGGLASLTWLPGTLSFYVGIELMTTWLLNSYKRNYQSKLSDCCAGIRINRAVRNYSRRGHLLNCRIYPICLQPQPTRYHASYCFRHANAQQCHTGDPRAQ